MKKHNTREQWLKAAVEILRPWYKVHEKLPKIIEPIVSWPKGSNVAIGQYFPKKWTVGEKVNYIAISPVLNDPLKVLDVLVHEMVHALDVTKNHGPEFKKVALALGLEGPMRATSASDELVEKLKPIAKKLGDYPHTQMVNLKEEKKSSKKTCVRYRSPADPKYSVWVSVKQAELVGPPICPISKKLMEEV